MTSRSTACLYLTFVPPLPCAWRARPSSGRLGGGPGLTATRRRRKLTGARMMRKGVVSLCLLFASVGPVAADPVTSVFITSGALVGDRQGAAVTLAGDGFTLTGVGGTTDGVWGPANSCVPCEPGAPVSFNAFWSGGDFHGTAQVGGQSYLLGSGDPGSGTASVVLAWAAVSGVAPAFTGAATASMAAPFTFTGIFTYPFIPSTELPASVSLLGSGTATVNLAWHTDGFWIFDNARYEFQSASAVPEPGTLLLIGAGAVTTLVQRRRQRRSRA